MVGMNDLRLKRFENGLQFFDKTLLVAIDFVIREVAEALAGIRHHIAHADDWERQVAPFESHEFTLLAGKIVDLR